MSKENQISDRILRQAVKKRDALKEELHEMELFIRTFARLAASKEEEEDEPAPPKGRSGIDASVFFRPVMPVLKKQIKSSPKRDVERVVRKILKDRDRPTTTAEMLQLVTERGITIGGREPRWNLAAKLSRMEDIESIKGTGWWFKNIPWKASEYILSSESEGPDA